MKKILNRFYYYKAMIYAIIKSKFWQREIKEIKVNQQIRAYKNFEKACKYNCEHTFNTYYTTYNFLNLNFLAEGYEERLKLLLRDMEAKSKEYIELKVLFSIVSMQKYYKNSDFVNLKKVYNDTFEKLDKDLLKQRLNQVSNKVALGIIDSFMAVYEIMFIAMCEENASRDSVLSFIEKWEKDIKLSVDIDKILENTKPKNYIKTRNALLSNSLHSLNKKYIYLFEKYKENNYQQDIELVEAYDKIFDIYSENVGFLDDKALAFLKSNCGLLIDNKFKDEDVLDTLKSLENLISENNKNTNSKVNNANSYSLFNIYETLKDIMDYEELCKFIRIYQEFLFRYKKLVYELTVKTDEELEKFKYYTNLSEAEELLSDKGVIRFKKADSSKLEVFNRLNSGLNNFYDEKFFLEDNAMYTMSFYEGSSLEVAEMDINETCGINFSSRTFCKNVLNLTNSFRAEFRNKNVSLQNLFIDSTFLIKLVYIDENNQPINVDKALFNNVIQSLEKLTSYVDNELTVGKNFVRESIHRNTFTLAYILKDSKYKDEKQANFFKQDFVKLNFDKEYIDANCGYRIKKISLDKSCNNYNELKKGFISKGVECE